MPALSQKTKGILYVVVAAFGFSMMSAPPEPDFCGLAIRPRIPVSWLICALEPRAPESSIMYTELKPCLSSLRVFMAGKG